MQPAGSNCIYYTESVIIYNMYTCENAENHYFTTCHTTAAQHSLRVTEMGAVQQMREAWGGHRPPLRPAWPLGRVRVWPRGGF